MKRAAVVMSLLGAAAVVTVVACSSSSSKGTGGGSDGGGVDVGVVDVVTADTLVVDPENCVPPGTPNNAEGVGGYCNPNGGQCLDGGPEGGGALCSADFGAPAHGWFCTYPCTGPSTCGPGMLCVSNAAGAGCVPATCLSIEKDGGYTILDGGND